MFKQVVTFLLMSSILSLASTKSVYRVWQPLSLGGTDVSNVAGKESGVDYTVVMSRPIVLSGALPEDLVYAVGRKHKIDSNGYYDQSEANLLVLRGVKLSAKFNEKGLDIQLDVSDLNKKTELDVALFDVVKLSIEALQKTLNDYGRSYLSEPMPCKITVVGSVNAAEMKQLEKLNTQFQTPVAVAE